MDAAGEGYWNAVQPDGALLAALVYQQEGGGVSVDFWHGKALPDSEREERMELLRRVFPSKSDLAQSQWQNKSENQKVNEDIQAQRNRLAEDEARQRLEEFRRNALHNAEQEARRLEAENRRLRDVEQENIRLFRESAAPGLYRKPNGHTRPAPANPKPEGNPFKRKMVI